MLHELINAGVQIVLVLNVSALTACDTAVSCLPRAQILYGSVDAGYTPPPPYHHMRSLMACVISLIPLICECALISSLNYMSSVSVMEVIVLDISLAILHDAACYRVCVPGGYYNIIICYMWMFLHVILVSYWRVNINSFPLCYVTFLK